MFTNLFCPVINTYFLQQPPVSRKHRIASVTCKQSDDFTWTILAIVLCSHLLLMKALHERPAPHVVETLPIPLQVSLVSTHQVAPEKPSLQMPSIHKPVKPVMPMSVVKKISPPQPKDLPLLHKIPVTKPMPLEKSVTNAIIKPEASETAEPVEKPREAIVSTPVEHTPPAPVAKVSKEVEPAPTFQSASFNAAYLHNPAPNYPSVSRRLKEEGKVLLQVQVNADGSADAVELQTSSGYSRLDDAALEAVKKWRFSPAKRNDQAVSASVIVPVKFSLEG